MATAFLIVNADDWGYSPRYNVGILEAARSSAIDAVSAMVLRTACEPEPLLACEVEIGLHLEDTAEAGHQVLEFERLFGRPPSHLDGHHHCHAGPPLAASVEELALQLDIAVRPAGDAHRDRLRGQGIATVERTIGRLSEREPALPAKLVAARREGSLAPGVTEWIVHPGYRNPELRSGYDRGREEDLGLLLELAGDKTLRQVRATHREALAR